MQGVPCSRLCFTYRRCSDRALKKRIFRAPDWAAQKHTSLPFDSKYIHINDEDVPIRKDDESGLPCLVLCVGIEHMTKEARASANLLNSLISQPPLTSVVIEEDDTKYIVRANNEDGVKLGDVLEAIDRKLADLGVIRTFYPSLESTNGSGRREMSLGRRT